MLAWNPTENGPDFHQQAPQKPQATIDILDIPYDHEPTTAELARMEGAAAFWAKAERWDADDRAAALYYDRTRSDGPHAIGDVIADALESIQWARVYRREALDLYNALTRRGHVLYVSRGTLRIEPPAGRAETDRALSYPLLPFMESICDERS